MRDFFERTAQGAALGGTIGGAIGVLLAASATVLTGPGTDLRPAGQGGPGKQKIKKREARSWQFTNPEDRRSTTPARRRDKSSSK